MQSREFIRYIPAWDGNRKKERPIIVEIKPLSMGDIKNYSKQIYTSMAKEAPGQIADNSAEIQEIQFLENVGKVENLVHPITGQPITTAAQLYEAPGLFPLVREIIKAMEDISVLKEGLKKKSEPPPAGV